MLIFVWDVMKFIHQGQDKEEGKCKTDINREGKICEDFCSIMRNSILTK